MTNKDIFYNTATFSINDGLKDLELSSGADWFVLLTTPTNANVRVKINSMTAHEIPVKEAWQIGSRDIHTIFISCDAVANEFITIGQHDGNLQIITNPKIDKLDSITTIQKFSDDLLQNLDKIVNPFEFVSMASYTTAGTSTATYYNAILDCDRIRLISNARNLVTLSNCFTLCSLDGKAITSTSSVATSSYGFAVNQNSDIIIDNVRGKNLNIIGAYDGTVTLEKYNLKV